MSGLEKEVRDLYGVLTKELIRKNLTITTMESCTGGQIVSLLTDTEGASSVVKGAHVTYSNEAKILQGVPKEVIETFGVYSRETAAAMACVCRKTYESNIGVGITGTFGNVDPMNPDSVIRQVFFAVDFDGEVQVHERRLGEQESRFLYKMIIAKELALVLQEMLL